MVKKENLEEDVNELAIKLKIKKYKVKKFSHNTTRSSIEYKSLFNEESKSIIESISQWEINKFGYKF